MTQGAGPRGGRFIWIALPAIVLAGLLVALSYCRTVSVLYVRYSQELSTKPQRAAAALAAGRRAADWAPWRPEAHGAVVRAAAGDAPEALAELTQELRWAPSDAYLWFDRAQQLARSGSFGGELSAALQTMNRLAPTSPTLQSASAWMGLHFWLRGDPQAREEWLFSLRYVLDRKGRHFLRAVKQNGMAEQLCWNAGAKLNIEAWCDGTLPD